MGASWISAIISRTLIPSRFELGFSVNYRSANKFNGYFHFLLMYRTIPRNNFPHGVASFYIRFIFLEISTIIQKINREVKAEHCKQSVNSAFLLKM